MELKEFVTDVLQQINDGVIEAQKRGVFVNPKTSVRPKEKVDYLMDGTPYHGRTHNVDFEVGLTNEEENGTGKFGVSFAGISVGVDGKNSASTTALTRIRFTIPIFLPLYPSEKD
mgnify:FL=1